MLLVANGGRKGRGVVGAGAKEREEKKKVEGQEYSKRTTRVGDRYLQRSRFMPLFAIGNVMQMRKSRVNRASIRARKYSARYILQPGSPTNHAESIPSRSFRESGRNSPREREREREREMAHSRSHANERAKKKKEKEKKNSHARARFLKRSGDRVSTFPALS